MAKGNSNKRGRDISIPSYRYSAPPVPRVRPLSVVSLPLLEDRRSFHPAPAIRPAFSSPRSTSRIVVRQRPSQGRFPSQTKGILSFEVPNRVAICVRRGVRKAVLHALGKAGKRGQRKPRRSAFSSISCR